MSATSRATSLAAALVCCGACTWANELDVCDQSRPAPREANRLTEGGQRVDTDRALGAMPFGGTLLAFVSDVSGDPDDRFRTEVRAAMLTPDGTPLSTCGADGERVLSPALRPPGAFELRGEPFVVPPDTDDGPGAVVYTLSSEISSQVWSVFLDKGACAYGVEMKSVQISEEPATTCSTHREDMSPLSRCVFAPVGVRLGSTHGAHRFAIVWGASLLGRNDEQVPGPASGVRGRLVEVRWNNHEFLPAQDRLDAAPVDLVRNGTVADMTVTSLDDHRFVLIWQERDLASRTMLRVFDDRLRPLSKEHLVHVSADPIVGQSLSAAFDGEHLHVLWAVSADRAVRITGRVVVLEGDVPRDLGPLSLPSSGGIQRGPAITALRDGAGFFVVWEALDEGSKTAALRGATLSPEGVLTFNNRSCDAAVFDLAPQSGVQTYPAIATTLDGSVVVAWTATDAPGADQSSSSVWSLALAQRYLFPNP